MGTHTRPCKCSPGPHRIPTVCTPEDELPTTGAIAALAELNVNMAVNAAAAMPSPFIIFSFELETEEEAARIAP